MKKVPHYIMRIASRALAMMDGNILRKWKSCWMQACTAGAVLLIAPPAFAALSVSIACNDFRSTGTSSCNYFLDGTAAELADIEHIKKCPRKIPSRVGRSLVTYHKNSYRILDDAKPRSSAYFAPDAAGALPLKFVITSKAGSSTTITPTSHVMRRGTMPLLPIEFTGMQLPSAGPQWSAGRCRCWRDPDPETSYRAGPNRTNVLGRAIRSQGRQGCRLHRGPGVYQDRASWCLQHLGRRGRGE